ncbi:MerR family transcriptional regulator [Oleiphilus messinensis]|uniref:MerR family transcriptional regulator n=1 Tax=Oleiphilus messinensis TaxID=141451 RepID=A0A1Y0I7I8_9GAMM|nr:helix-turn-helix domain-containing protein [Oleiphilus messinensis]ARU56462.1 MerR family transcriptional regulator [Oleiphilus messinensis]
MDIGEVSKRTNLPASTLRYYEEKGLIASNGRNGLKRTYKSSVIQKLALITLGRNAGLSLDEIKDMLLPDGLKIDRAVLLNKADELDSRIAALTAMRDGLRHAAACQAPQHLECPKFLRILNIAGRRWGRPSRRRKP